MWAKIKAIFCKPKVRVRKIGGLGSYVYGTVVDEATAHNMHFDETLTYWLITWDDHPGYQEVMPSWNFVWHDGFWTTYPV